MFNNELKLEDIKKENDKLHHSWVCVKMKDGKWKILDPTFGDNVKPKKIQLV